MAIFLVTFFGLLSVGSAEEIVKNQMLELAITLGPTDSDNFHQQIVEETQTQSTKSRQRISQIINNASQVTQSGKPRHRIDAESPEQHLGRIKRNPTHDPQCGLNPSPVGTNDFESSLSQGGTKYSWDRNKDESSEIKPLSNLNEITVTIHRSHPPKRCLTKRQLRYFDTVQPKIPLVNDTKNNKQSYKLVKTTPSEYIRKYAKNKTDGCRCSTENNKLGCVCCLFLSNIDIVLCAGCGFDPEKEKIVVEITTEDQVIYKWVKNVTQNAFTGFLKKYTKPLCYEKVWRIFKVNICVRMLGSLDLSFSKGKKSKLSLCPRVTAYILFWDLTVFDPHCWELEFEIPGFGQRGIAGRANGLATPKLTYEKNTLQLTNPVKTMFVIENFEDTGKLIFGLWESEMSGTRALIENGRATGGKMVQNYGEEPKILKTGKPTDPVNWEPTDISKLDYLVVLYTQPFPSPLTVDDEDVKDIPGFSSMIQDGLGRRTEDPSYLNLKVKASMGKTCGGVALTADKILTLCACVKYFYLYHKHNEKPKGTDNDPFTMISPDIYVTFADRQFTADQMVYELDHDVNKFAKNSKCFKAIENKEGIYNMHMLFVVMSVTPELKKIETLQLVPFLDNASGRTKAFPAEMTIIGMKKRKSMDLFDTAGNELDPLYEVVKIPFKSCAETQFCKKFLTPANSQGGAAPTEFREKTMCFCAKDNNFQLCDGVIGFPVITSEGLIGLNTLPVHCKAEGSMITALLSAGAINEINGGPNGDHPASSPMLDTVPFMMTIISLSSLFS